MAVASRGPEFDQLRDSLKKEVAQQAAKWLVAATVGLVTVAATGWWLYLLPKLKDLTGGVPTGAVAAFDAPRACPRGWSAFEEAAGRTIIGAGRGAGLSERRYREIGGEERHLITLDEMPEHRHEVIEMVADNNVDGVDSVTTNSSEHHNEKRLSGPAGGSAPEPTGPANLNNNMPPYVALTYCIKD